MANELTVISQENVQAIAVNAPQMFADCKQSHDRCIAAGKNLLERIQAAGGKLNDELDQECALYLEKGRKTLKKMNDLRSPLTKMFDEFKSVFTTMENDVNVSKAGNVLSEIQALRNTFAAEKRAEEERRRQEEIRRAQMENARKQWRSDCENEFQSFYTATVNNSINKLNALFSGITLENFEQQAALVRNFDCNLPADWHTMWRSQLPLPLAITREESSSIRDNVRLGLNAKFAEQFKYELESNVDDLVNRLPSKKRELEQIAKAGAEEAERRRQEIATREAEEARRREEERRAREEEERRQAEMAKKNAEMEGLFGAAAASTPTYVPKTSVKKRINVLNVEGYAAIFGLWWAKVGVTLSSDELAKTFKTQITYCEKLANDKNDPVFLQDESVEYVDEVKAK